LKDKGITIMDGEKQPEISGTRREVAFLQTLNKISTALQQTSHSEKDFYRTFCEMVISSGFYSTIHLLNESNTRLCVKAIAYPAAVIHPLENISGWMSPGSFFRLDKVEVFKEVLEKRKTVYREDNTRVITDLFPDYSRELFFRKISNEITEIPGIYIPLMSTGKLLGVLGIESRNLKETDIPAVEAFAYHIAVALDNCYLLTRLKENEIKLLQQTEDLKLINELNAALNVGKSLYKIFTLLSEETRRIFSCKSVAIYLYNPNNHELTLQTTKPGSIIAEGIEQITGIHTRHLTFTLRRGCFYDDILKKKRLSIIQDSVSIQHYIQDYIEFIEFPDSSLKNNVKEFVFHLYGILQIESLLLYPMIAGEDIIGIIEFTKERSFSAEEIHRLEVITGQLTTAIKRKQNQDELQRLSHAIKQSPSMIVITDTVGNIEYVNFKFTEVTGYHLSEVYGKHVRLLKSGKTSPTLYTYLWQTITAGGEWRGEFCNRKKNGELYWEDAHISPIRNDTGEIIHYLAVKNDITERRRIEQELFKARKLESIGILAGGIAHDFNNLLSGILGNINLAKIRVKEDQSELLTLLAEAETASLNAKDLTQQLLTFSKGGSPVKKTVSLVNLIEETVRFALRGSNVKWEFHYPEDLWPVEIDTGQMNQVINNLVINADQAMADGGKLTITAKNSFIDDGHYLPLIKGKYIILSFHDTGIGIPEYNIPKVFDPYFSTKENGNGLGLATAYSMVKKHGGIILVDSTPHVGSTFYVYLPAVENHVKEEIPPIENNLPHSARVLIMDDEKLVRRVLAKMLKHLGYEVVEVKDGEEAFQEYKRFLHTPQKFDLVIMDLTIPGGTGGKETVKKLRGIDPGIKVIVSSGYSNDPTLASYKKYGFDGVVNKPYKLNELEDALKKVL
jgi:PAS domain S-box-containing protein